MTKSGLWLRNFFTVLYTDTRNANKEDFLSDKSKIILSTLINKSQPGLCSLVQFERKKEEKV